MSGYEGGLVMGVHRDAIGPGENVPVVDEVLAAGWSAWGGVQLVRKMGADCLAVAVAIELGHLSGRSNLAENATIPLFAASRSPDNWSAGA